MSERFFVPTPLTGDRIVLEGSEARHLAVVMRAHTGQHVTLFDGSGRECVAEVAAVSSKRVELSVVSVESIDREAAVDITLGAALPKGDRQRWLIEKLVELGVREFVPLLTQRSVARPVAKAVARLERTVIEASKQCGRNRLMTIGQPQPWDEFVTAAPETAPRLLAHPGGLAATSLALAAGGPHYLAIGPEGGFTDEEVQSALDRGWQTVDLGPRNLRVETAATLLVAVALLSARP